MNQKSNENTKGNITAKSDKDAKTKSDVQAQSTTGKDSTDDATGIADDKTLAKTTVDTDQRNSEQSSAESSQTDKDSTVVPRKDNPVAKDVSGNNSHGDAMSESPDDEISAKKESPKDDSGTKSKPESDDFKTQTRRKSVHELREGIAKSSKESDIKNDGETKSDDYSSVSNSNADSEENKFSGKDNSGIIKGVIFAGFWIRLFAFIIDFLILFFIDQAISSIAIREFTMLKSLSAYVDMEIAVEEYERRGLINYQDNFEIFVMYLILYLKYVIDFMVIDLLSLKFLTPFLIFFYFAFMESSQIQATIGKLLFGLKVVDGEGDRIGFKRATARFFSKYLSTLILFIGFLMIGLSKSKQGLHDMIAETLVVKRHYSSI